MTVDTQGTKKKLTARGRKTSKVCDTDPTLIVATKETRRTLTARGKKNSRVCDIDPALIANLKITKAAKNDEDNKSVCSSKTAKTDGSSNYTDEEKAARRARRRRSTHRETEEDATPARRRRSRSRSGRVYVGGELMKAGAEPTAESIDTGRSRRRSRSRTDLGKKAGRRHSRSRSIVRVLGKLVPGV